MSSRSRHGDGPASGTSGSGTSRRRRTGTATPGSCTRPGVCAAPPPPTLPGLLGRRRAMAATNKYTFLDIARTVGHQYGYALSDDEAAVLLWEHTGYPSFWEGDPAKCCEAQLVSYFDALGAPGETP